MKEIIDTNSLAHTSWNCKYHIVFAPKYRRKVFFEEKRLEIREILWKLCQWKGVEIIEGEGMVSKVEIQSNFITGYYGRNGFANFLKRCVENGKVLYVDKEKAEILETESSTQWLEQLERIDFDIIIRKTSAVVNTSVKNSFAESIKKINADNPDVKYSSRDSEGNIIPLSERFNTENDDIRYSYREETKNAFNPKGESIEQQLTEAYSSSESKDGRYVYVGMFTKSFSDMMSRNGVEIKNYPIVMNYRFTVEAILKDTYLLQKKAGV